MTPTGLDRLAQVATVLGALLTAGSVIVGLVTYRRSVTEQRQAAALGILHEYLKLSVEHPELASRERGQAIDASYDAFVTHALATAETAWALVGDDRRWDRSIGAVVLPHREYLTQGVLHCENYQTEFLQYLRERVPGVQCAP